ncbi:LytTR family DNA-binding domain-containing protein [Clostridium massiliamazoniense]|uniref:LytR/AlgR family response regulator transcription factor n=1 Tax=Clostridium massiliamazoniense TaxID=1347366 RepID=UPI003119E188
MDVIIDIFEEPEKFLFKFKDIDNQYNIVFINVDLDMQKGIYIARCIKEINSTTQIIFFSRSKKYILEGYDIGISNYLLKPTDKDLKDIDKEKIEKEFLKVLNKIYKIEKNLFCINKKAGLKILNIEDILFFETNNRMVTAVTKNGKLDFYDKITNLEKKLNNSKFIRCHRGFLVNPEHIVEMNKESLILNYNYSIPISRLKITEVKDKLLDYLANNNKVVFS